MREVGSSSCLSYIKTGYNVERDVLTFNEEELETLGIDNPLHFSNINSMVSITCAISYRAYFPSLLQNNLQLVVSVTDVDTFFVMIRLIFLSLILTQKTLH